MDKDRKTNLSNAGFSHTNWCITEISPSHSVDKDVYPVKELELRDCNIFYIELPTHRYQHSSAYLLRNVCNLFTYDG